MDNNANTENENQDAEMNESEELRSMLEDAMEAHADELENEDTDTNEENTADEDTTETTKEDDNTDDKSAEAASEGDGSEGGEDKSAGKEDKAPLRWNAQAREKWKSLDPVVKQQIKDREKHVDQVLRDGADNRKTGERLNQLATSYQSVMAAEGVTDPMQAVEGLFKTVATLRMGTPEQKAQTVAQLIGVYGVDINTLDEALVSGQQPQQSQPNGIDPSIQAMIDQKMAPVTNMINQMNTQQANNVQTELSEFAGQNEFYNDVKLVMADFLDIAAKNGQKMSLKEAYDRACLADPHVSQVISDRKAQEALMGNQNNAANKRVAASTLGSSSANSTAPATDGSIRGDLMAAMEAHS